MALITVGGILGLIYWLWFSAAADSWLKTGIKSATLGLPAVALALSGWPPVFVAGLVACVIGDFLLSRPGDRALMAGIAAFAVGHLLYIAAMLAGFELTQSWVVPVLLILLGLSTERWLAPHTGELRMPVRVYVVVILAMGITAAWTGAPLILAGALTFVASDLILSLDLFDRLKGLPKRFAPYAVWGLYVLAQALLIAGFAPEGF